MKILLAIDGSPCSLHAVEEVSRRPWPAGSHIRVLTAYEVPVPATPEGWLLPAEHFDELDRSIKNQATEIVQNALRTLRSKLPNTLTVEALVIPGSPRAVILDEAKSWDADLILVGSHGYRAWERFLMGSVSQAVVSHAKCSVEVVRAPKSLLAPDNKKSIQKVGM
jgi:nucleotide-binding universal stress UspA family protein